MVKGGKMNATVDLPMNYRSSETGKKLHAKALRREDRNGARESADAKWGGQMELSTYQAAAGKTDKLAADKKIAIQVAALGIVGEAGSIASVVKKYLRDGVSYDSYRNFLTEELGDVLWYVANLARLLDLDLDKIAEENLRRANDQHGDSPLTDSTPALDAAYEAHERFPRQMRLLFEEAKRGDGEPLVSVKILSAEPYAFASGVAKDQKSGKPIGFALGNPLTDNSRGESNYRYHDCIHIAFMTVLGWSPVMRELLRIKRKSAPMVDEVEDGARAKDIEEGISAYLFSRAPELTHFDDARKVDGDTLAIVARITAGLEVSAHPRWRWREAIALGFRLWHDVKSNHGGYVTVDLDQRQATYSKL
jgi:NTP pyrophosphatase (non-canonical NTP hydrolase)